MYMRGWESEATATEAAATASAEATSALALSALTLSTLHGLEDLKQLLRSEDAGKLGAVLLLNIQAKLLLLDLLCLTSKDFVQLSRSLFVGKILVTIVLAFAVLLGASGSQFVLIPFINGFELGLLLAFELEVPDKAFCHTCLHLLTTSVAVVILSVCCADGAEKEGDKSGQNNLLFHCNMSFCYCCVINKSVITWL